MDRDARSLEILRELLLPSVIMVVAVIVLIAVIYALYQMRLSREQKDKQDLDPRMMKIRMQSIAKEKLTKRDASDDKGKLAESKED